MLNEASCRGLVSAPSSNNYSRTNTAGGLSTRSRNAEQDRSRKFNAVANVVLNVQDVYNVEKPKSQMQRESGKQNVVDAFFKKVRISTKAKGDTGDVALMVSINPKKSIRSIKLLNGLKIEETDIKKYRKLFDRIDVSGDG